MVWCSKPKPAKAPPTPRNITPGMLAVIRAAVSKFPTVPANVYLKAHLPVEEFDRWMQPLPLSIVQQDRLNRMMAVILAPIDRGRALLLSGTLDTLECEAIKEAHPDAYQILKDQAVREMVQSGGSLPQWSEAVLGVLFQRDAAHVFVEEKTDKEGKPLSGGAAARTPIPTPSEQMDSHERK